MPEFRNEFSMLDDMTARDPDHRSFEAFRPAIWCFTASAAWVMLLLRIAKNFTASTGIPLEACRSSVELNVSH
jgi:hypothetical protein